MKQLLKILAATALGASLSLNAATVTIPAGGLTGTVNWTANNEYLLDGWVYVLDGATLNIEAGTIIRGKEAASAPNYGALFVCRGGKINALGTRLRPIIFTTESDDINDPDDIPLADEGGGGRGLWGGVVILGKGRINRADAEASGSGTNPDGSKYQLYEGLPDTVISSQNVHRFGGNDDNDNSGTLRFVSIRYSGKALDANKELNALSLAGVGRGTTIEFVEVYAGADDGFEWWGGAVNTRYLVASYCSDEMFDMDQGHMGKHQFWFGLQAITGDEGIEMNGQPTGGANVQVVGLQPFGQHEIYNVTLIGEGPGSTSGSDVMNTRAEYYGNIHNSVFTQFQGRRVTESVANNYGYVANNLFFDIYGAGATGDSYGDANAPAALNPIADPQLRGISRIKDGGLDPRPLPTSPVFTGYRETPENGWFCPAPYKGAFNANDNWLLGWTALYQNGHLKQKSPTLQTISAGGLTGTHTWTADKEYLLDGWVYVLDGATLNIEAGTVIRGKEAAAAPNYGALYVCRGGKLNAIGSPANPIIFTTESDDINDPLDIPLADEGSGGRGLWGGVVILGKARINRADAEASGSGTNPDGSKYQLYEGLPDTVISGQNVHRFGGNDDEDNSGTLKYVSIRYSGKALDANKELNGLSMAAVGRGTTIECVEVYAGADDAFEWWGGAVNTRYLVASYSSDEMFDMDQGHMGKHQFWFGLQAITGDEGIEMNGQPTGGANVQVVGLQPFGRHEIYNVTLIGEGPGSTSGSDVMNTRAEYYGNIHNSVFTQFQGRRVTESVANNYGYVANNLFFDIYGAGATGDSYGDTNAPAALNPIADPLLLGISRLQNKQLDPRPAANSPVYTGWRTPPVNGWFEQTAFKGAFDKELWIADWTALTDNEHLKPVPGTTTKCPVPAPQPEVTINAAGTQATLTWTAYAGLKYQVQTSNDLVTWTNEGASQLAGGETTTTLTHVSSLGGAGAKKHFRVIASR